MCKRGRTKHCAKDDLALVREHAKFGYSPHRNPLTDQHRICTLEYVIDLTLIDVPEIIEVS